MASPTDESVLVGQVSANNASSASSLAVPLDRIVCIEHPCIVKNIDNGVKSLGGEQHLQKLLLPPGETPEAVVSLRPRDPFAKKLIGREAYVNNVLLRIVLPKRTGRKRKRGTTGPFVNDGNVVDQNERPLTGPELLQRIRDNQHDFTIEPVGVVHETHRFHSLPDFQMQAGNVPIFQQIADNLLDPKIEHVKKFKIDTAVNPVRPPHIVAPPQFSQIVQHMSYQYEQNPAVTTVTNEKGKRITINRQKKETRAVYAFAADTPTVPDGPPATLLKLEEANKYMQQAVKNLKGLLKERPIVTRRAAYNLCDFGSESLFKDATQYACYSFKSGPWKDALIKYGLDPRKDPSYRKYQTLNFQISSKDTASTGTKQVNGGANWTRAERVHRDNPTDDRPPSHIFDGKQISTNGKMWQVCDLTEPCLAGLLSTSSLRETCDTFTSGWYHNGTWCTARVMMRDQIGTLLSGSQISAQDHDIYRTLVAEMPDELVSEESFKMSYVNDVNGKRSDKIQGLSTSIRSMAKSDASIKARALAESSRVGKGNKKEKVDDDEEGEEEEQEEDNVDGNAMDDIEMVEHEESDDEAEDGEGQGADQASSPGE